MVGENQKPWLSQAVARNIPFAAVPFIAEFLVQKRGPAPWLEIQDHNIRIDVEAMQRAIATIVDLGVTVREGEIESGYHGSEMSKCPIAMPDTFRGEWWPVGPIGEFFADILRICSIQSGKMTCDAASYIYISNAVVENSPELPCFDGLNEFRFTVALANWTIRSCPIWDVDKQNIRQVGQVVARMVRRKFYDCFSPGSAARSTMDMFWSFSRLLDTASKLALGMTPECSAAELKLVEEMVQQPDQPAGQADQRVRPFGSSARDDHPAMDRDELLTAMGSVQDDIEYYQERIRNMNTRQEEIHPIKEKIDQLYREHSHYREILQSLGKADGPPAA